MGKCILMIGRRVRDQDTRSKRREEKSRERLDRLEELVCAQHDKLDRLEDLVYRVMHRDRVAGPDFSQYATTGQQGPPPSVEPYETSRTPSEDTITTPKHRPELSAQLYPISSV